MERNKLQILDHPQCLIKRNEGKELEVVKDVVDQISELEGSIVSVAMTGICRTGKSYLLNKLADTPSCPGFEMSREVTALTKGIWIWARPHRRLSNSYLLLMDTEGLSDARQDDRGFDHKILTLATLLSAVLLYNVKGHINEEMLANLAFISEVASNIKFSEDGDDAAFMRPTTVFPKLIVLLRDFTLKLEKDGEKITADEYLDDLLESGDYGDIDGSIQHLFSSRKCFVFDSPGARSVIEDLAKSEAGISEDFKKDVQKLKDYIEVDCRPMKLKGRHDVTGQMFANLVTNYVEAVSTGVPYVETAHEQVMRKENNRTLDRAVEIYTDHMTSMLHEAQDIDTLEKTHDEAEKRAMDYFKRMLKSDPAGGTRINLMASIGKKKVHFAKTNMDKSIEKCNQIIKRFQAPKMSRKINKREYDCEGGSNEFEKDLIEVEKEYYKQTIKNNLTLANDEAWDVFYQKMIIEKSTIERIEYQIRKKSK